MAGVLHRLGPACRAFGVAGHGWRGWHAGCSGASREAVAAWGRGARGGTVAIFVNHATSQAVCQHRIWTRTLVISI